VADGTAAERDAAAVVAADGGAADEDEELVHAPAMRATAAAIRTTRRVIAGS
jgi:hypothetical protein